MPVKIKCLNGSDVLQSKSPKDYSDKLQEHVCCVFRPAPKSRSKYTTHVLYTLARCVELNLIVLTTTVSDLLDPNVSFLLFRKWLFRSFHFMAALPRGSVAANKTSPYFGRGSVATWQCGRKV